MKTQKGFTITELLAVLVLLFSLACVGGIVYVAWHFISKFW
jgi:prepilin-type N-terminal cleavage/methylation domain-containing protein